uniref:Uncharacterized protein n=1 Tax=Solanum tuberosum TaxID=4113 RepID=M1DS73_SOLTU
MSQVARVLIRVEKERLPKEAKYIGDEYVNRERLVAEFPHIHAQVLALGLQYIFVDQSECNLGQVLSIADRQAWDDSYMRRMYGMAELQLRIGSYSVTEDELETLAERYPLTNSAMYMCWIGPVFQEPIDDYDALLMKRMDWRRMSQMILAPEMIILIRVMVMVKQHRSLWILPRMWQLVDLSTWLRG